jgi:hypothetical protein
MPRHVQLHRPDRDGPALCHVMQERLIGTTAQPAPRHELGSDPQAGPRMVVVKAEDSRQVPVDRRRAPDPGAVCQHDHVARRGAQPGHEPGHVLNARLVPADRGVAEELEPQPQADRVGTHRVGRALDRRQVGKIALGGLHHFAVVPQQRPGLRAAGHQHFLDEHAPPPSGSPPGRLPALKVKVSRRRVAEPRRHAGRNAIATRHGLSHSQRRTPPAPDHQGDRRARPVGFPS